MRRKDKRTPMKVLVDKTLRFVEMIWLVYTIFRWCDSGCAILSRDLKCSDMSYIFV